MKIQTHIVTLALILGVIFLASLAAVGLVWLVVQVGTLIFAVL